MGHSSTQRRQWKLGALSVAALAALSVAVLSGKGEAGPAPSKDARQVAASSKVDKDPYTVELKAPASCKAGSECKAEISLQAKLEFHVNDKFPIKFKGADPPGEGVSYTKGIVKKEDGKFGEKSGTLPIGFTVAKAGKARVGGVFSFSVCTETNCLMEKIEVEVEVEAK